MSVVAKVLLKPVPSSRGAGKPPDAEIERVFEALPGKGDRLTLDDSWPEDVRGRAYMVSDVNWPIDTGHRPHTVKPVVDAIRCS